MKFNTLYHGSAVDVIDEMEDQEATVDELRAALINAMRRIDYLERAIFSLQKDLNE